MFIDFPYGKYRREPRFIGPLPIVGFLNRRKQPVAFRRGRWLAPVVLEADYLAYLRSALLKPSRKPSRKPAPRPPVQRKAPPAARVTAVPSGWLPASVVLEKLNKEFPGYVMGKRTHELHGFFFTKGKRDKLKNTIWAEPRVPSLTGRVVGFNMFVMVRAFANSPDSKNKKYELCGVTISWHGPLAEILERAYSPTAVRGKSIQDIVSYRTELDKLAFLILFLGDRPVGQPIKLVGLQFLRKFTRQQVKRFSDRQRKYQRKQERMYRATRAKRKARRGKK